MRRAISRALPLLFVAVTACRGTAERVPAGLQATVDSLLPRLEVLSGLEARAPVRVAIQSRDEMLAYVERQLEEELPPAELEGVRASYAAFGLIADTLDLRGLLLDLYSEQVVGYYDPETDRLYMVEGVASQEAVPVIAHELVHALQDQHTNLDSLIARTRGNDPQTAAQAAIEGHATLVMFAWMLEARTGGAISGRQLPDLTPQLEPLLEAQNDQFPVFRSAPRIIRETLLFPYVRGAAFVQTLWRVASGEGGGYPAPFGEYLPVSTEQVIHAQDRFFQNRDDPTPIVLEPATGGWRAIYENCLGELETRILLEEHLGREAGALATGWDGDRYRLMESPAGERVLVWYSVWDDAAAADAFADAYRRILTRRPGRAGRVDRLDSAGRPFVRVIDAPAGVSLDAVPVPDISEI